MTRATRIAKLAPGVLFWVEVIGKLPKAHAADPQGRRWTPMTSDMQKEAMAVLGEVWSLSPDVRLGQLLAHLGFLGEAHVGRGLGYIDDDELLAILYRHRAELLARLGGESEPEPHRSGAAISVSGSPTLPEPTPSTELH